MNESSKSRVTWLIILGIIVFALIMFRQVLVPGSCLFTTDDNIGSIKVSKDSLPGAFLGSWVDSVYLGVPGGIVPFMWNSLLVGLTPVALYINWVHAFDLALASWFLLVFLRERKVGWVAIGLGFLTAFWLGSNLTLTYAGHIGKYGVLMFAGVALCCIQRSLSKQPSILWGILSGGAIGLMFLEQLDVALFFGFVLGAYALFLAIRQWLANGTWAKSAVALILMGGVGVLIAGSTMFSSYASNVKGTASMQTESPQEKWEYVTQWSWPPDECIDFIAPGYMGWRSGESKGPYWGRMGRSAGWERTQQGFMNFKLENMYLGIIPILLALFAVLMAIMARKTKSEPRMDTDGHGCRTGEGIVAVRGSARTAEALNAKNEPQMTRMHTDIPERRAEIIFWGCVAVITLLLAFGKFFPLNALFYQLPMVSSIRNPNKFLQVFQLALGILAAYGLDGMLREAGRRTTDDG
ncbi:MAG: hypothetical protein Q7J98_13780 [Kiritimatiellia bacterium]|nr:hypothetical protein [Kiritimatiellia bacterium]